MNQIACCDWLPEPARWSHLARGPSCPLGTTGGIPQAKFHQKPYNKSFIDQVCLVKMAGYWLCPFFCEFMDLAKKELSQYPAILTSHLVNNPYLLLFNFVIIIINTITIIIIYYHYHYHYHQLQHHHHHYHYYYHSLSSWLSVTGPWAGVGCCGRGSWLGGCSIHLA